MSYCRASYGMRIGDLEGKSQWYVFGSQGMPPYDTTYEFHHRTDSSAMNRDQLSWAEALGTYGNIAGYDESDDMNKALLRTVVRIILWEETNDALPPREQFDGSYQCESMHLSTQGPEGGRNLTMNCPRCMQTVRPKPENKGKDGFKLNQTKDEKALSLEERIVIPEAHEGSPNCMGWKGRLVNGQLISETKIPYPMYTDFADEDDEEGYGGF